MSSTVITLGVCLSDEHALELAAFALACGVDEAGVRVLVEEGLVRAADDTQPWHFDGEALARVRRIARLQRDFDANLQSVGVMLHLLDEVERLRAALRRAGVADA